ncbi:hypothetical protein XI09_23735 [Bradyrhizobium sp. CCBAU 11386]|nr:MULTISPECIES: hypothetical protein [unclassified Bradyrhizobium]MDA9507590.1 hypothetical protein [Bradyrhizobium sp. CCBAU 11386]SFI33448.1 hypothetical protein SAMN04487925_102763 [Bradyrhizobium sp. cf659]
MQPTSRFDATFLHLHALIADLDWRVRMLDADIREEEDKAGNADPSSSTYPMLAQTMRTRQDNLRASIAMLESRLPADVARAA